MTSDYQRIERAIKYLRENAVAQPGLQELADACGLSPYHFQRLFRRWAGVSPKQFLQYLTVQHARQLMTESASTLEAAFEVGLSGPGRLHDHFVTIEAVTPGDVKRLGRGLTIQYGVSESPFGRIFVALTQRGVCALEFIDEAPPDNSLNRLRERWPNAILQHDETYVTKRLENLFNDSGRKQQIRVLVQGTNFQIQVWQALLNIPPGHVCAYGQLAAYIGKPEATRAVASAIGANAVAYLIPCHRVLRAGGELGGYRWGLTRKQALLGREYVRARNKRPETTLTPAISA